MLKDLGRASKERNHVGTILTSVKFSRNARDFATCSWWMRPYFSRSAPESTSASPLGLHRHLLVPSDDECDPLVAADVDDLACGGHGVEEHLAVVGHREVDQRGLGVPLGVDGGQDQVFVNLELVEIVPNREQGRGSV